MKNNKDLDRRIDMGNIFNINRLSFEDTFESGESLTFGLDYSKQKIIQKNNIKEIEDYFDFKLATVFRLNDEKNIPKKKHIK